MTRCAWHGCCAEFTPEDPRQRFCGKDCQRKRAAWKERRGATLVDLLLSGNSRALIEAKRKIEKEVTDETARNCK